jgi:hypothetical protein
MIDATCTCRTGADRVQKKTGKPRKILCEGRAARKQEEKLGDLESKRWLAETSILIVDDDPDTRSFPVRELQWSFSRVLARRLFAASVACPVQ